MLHGLPVAPRAAVPKLCTPLRLAWQRALRASMAVLCCCVWLVGPALALDPARPLTEFVHDRWSVDSGLPQTTIASDIVQTPDGYLWFGTHEGLARFNGHQFRVFNTDNAPALGSNGILQLAVARNGDLLIGLRDGGLARYHAGQITAVAMPDVQAGVLAIVEEPDGTLWIGTRGAGLLRLPADGSEPAWLHGPAALPDDVVVALMPSPDGFLWVGTRQGLARLHWEDGQARISAEPGLPVLSVADLMRARDGRLWLSSDDAGLWVQDGAHWRQYSVADGLAGTTVGPIHEDPDGAIWLGMLTGVQRLVDGRFDTPIGVREGLTSALVRALFIDIEGGLWVGTANGIDRFRDGRIHTIRPGYAPGEDGVRSVSRDHLGGLWIGTVSGLFRYDQGQSVRFGLADGLVNESVLAVAEDFQGAVWVATQGGVNRRNGERFVDQAPRLLAATGRAQAAQRVLLAVRGGMLIGGAVGVLLLRDDGGFERYGRAEGLPSEDVLSLQEDRHGRLWVGLRFGVARLKPAPAGTGRRYLADPLPAEFGFRAPVFGFAEWTAQRLLMVTGRGLKLAQDDQLHSYAGLDRTLFNLREDGTGHWWMCSNSGLVRVASAALEAGLKPGSGALPFDSYDRSDGMPTTQCAGGAEPSATVLANGDLAFATSRGVAVVDPARRIAPGLQPLSVQIESAEIDFQAVALPSAGAALVVQPGQRRIELSYVAPTMNDPSGARYRYQLEGEDRQWIDAGDRRAAVLANLAPGRYRFRVGAGNGAGDWSEHEAVMDILVLPHWSQSWWFRALLLAAAVLALYVGVRLRLAALARKARELSALVVERTTDLATERDRLAQANLDKTRLLDQVAAQAAQFERLARQDGLTQLANRRELDQVLQTAYAQANPVFLALGDVDHFKSINDHYSHTIGDDVLRTLADILRAHCGSADLAARFGGEELAMVLPGVDRAQAMAQIDALRSAIANHAWHSLHPKLSVTISFGLAHSSEAGGVNELIALADQRLYRSKSAGRNQLSA